MRTRGEGKTGIKQEPQEGGNKDKALERRERKEEREETGQSK